MTREEALVTLHRLAVLAEQPGPAAVARLLERLSTQDSPEELRALLVEIGAEAILRDVEEVGRIVCLEEELRRRWLRSTNRVAD